MDRIDIYMQVFQVEYQKLRDTRQGESSAEIRARMETARQRQRARFAGTGIASTPIWARLISGNTARWIIPARR